MSRDEQRQEIGMKGTREQAVRNRERIVETPAKRKPHQDRRPVAPMPHWWAAWSWRARSMIVRCRRKSWMPDWRRSKADQSIDQRVAGFASCLVDLAA